MTTGLDEWIPNLSNFFEQARQYLKVSSARSSRNSPPISTTPDSQSSAQGPSKASPQPSIPTAPSATAPPSESAHLDTVAIREDLFTATPLDLEVAMLTRAQRRHNSTLTPEVLNNLELAAYYARLLLNVCSKNPSIR